MRSLHIKISNELHLDFKILAMKEGKNMNEIARELIEKYVKDKKEVK